MTACGPVLIKFDVSPDSDASGAYEIKINGTPDSACVIVLRSYFTTTAGKELYDEVTLSSKTQWQSKQQEPADSIAAFVRTEIVSSTGCSCIEDTSSSGAGSLNTPNMPGVSAEPADSNAAAAWTQASPSSLEDAAPDTAAVTVPAPGNAAYSPDSAPLLPAQPADTVSADAWADLSDFSWREEEDSITVVSPDTTDAWAAAASLPLGGMADSAAVVLPDTTDVWAEAPPLPPKEESNPAAVVPDTAAVVSEVAAVPPVATVPPAATAPKEKRRIVTNDFWQIARDSASLLQVMADQVTEDRLLKIMTQEELDSIRVNSDPFILEGLHTIADAFVRIDEAKLARGSVAATARQELDLLEEKQQIFMEKYTKLVKSGRYGLNYCSACYGSPIIFRPDGYPPFEACGECKGGGYHLTYHGNAKPNTIEYLYFAELLPSPDYRKPTLKRIAENPANFDYENGIFKTEVEELSAARSPYFFVCMYYKGDERTHNRMFITEIISKKEHDMFAGAGKAGVKLLLEPFLPESAKKPDEVYIWEFNSYEDAYNRSIVPLHRAGVVGFEIEVLQYK